VINSAIESFKLKQQTSHNQSLPNADFDDHTPRDDCDLYLSHEECEDGATVRELRATMNERPETVVDATIISEVPSHFNIQNSTQQQEQPVVKENRRLQFGVLNFVHWWLDGIGFESAAREVTAIFHGGRHSQLTSALLRQNEKLLHFTETRLGGGKQRHRHASSHSTHSTLVSNPLKQKSFIRDDGENSDEVLSFFDELEEDRVRSENSSSS
jgi:hypothetical protein